MCDKEDKATSILTMLRLSIGHLDTEQPNDEEKSMIEEVCQLGDSINDVLVQSNPRLIIATVTLVQILEDILCSYEEEMPNLVTAVTCKLTHHGSHHIRLKDENIIKTPMKNTIH